MNEYGKFIRRSDSDFVVNVDVNIKDSGYNVVPFEIDQYNAFDIASVMAYVQSHAEMEVSWNEEKAQYLPVSEK